MPIRSKQVFQRHPISRAIALVLIPAWAVGVNAQSFVNYDGSAATDFNSAVASWADADEFKKDWGLGAMNAQFAYARGLSGKNVKLGAVDSGLRFTHQEFVGRDAVAVQTTGTYLNGGSFDAYGADRPWLAGDSFDVTGEYLTGQINDGHGSHVSGTIAAAKDGREMMGVSFNSSYFTSNTFGADGAIYGTNMDYSYFKTAYGNVAAAGARAINSSWGSPGPTADSETVELVVKNYVNYFVNIDKKTWLQGVAEVSQRYPALQVFAAGNTAKHNINIRSSLPYFSPDIEKNWIAVAAVDSTLSPATFTNFCGLAKYWCLSAPGVGIYSLNVTDTNGNDKYKSSSGTSMAAPHATGALGLVMERYPALGNDAIRTIFLTTAKHLGDGPTDVPDPVFGWGIPDLNQSMSGPMQLLGAFEANVATGSDTWTNPMSQAALDLRRSEEAAEIAAWPDVKAGLQASIKTVPALVETPAQALAEIAAAKSLLKAAIILNTGTRPSVADMDAALEALDVLPTGAKLLELYEASNPTDWGGSPKASRSPVGIYEYFMGDRSDGQLASDLSNIERLGALSNNKTVAGALVVRQLRIDALAAKQASDYVGSLTKKGGGVLTLAGANTYKGLTDVQQGTLRSGVVNAFASSAIKVASGATFDATGSGDAVVAGLTNAGTVTLADGITGQTLTVNGPMVGQGGTVRLDLAVVNPQASKEGVQNIPKDALSIVNDRVVVNGAVSGVTTVSLVGAKDLTAAALANGLQLISSTEPLPPGSFVLDGPLVVDGKTYVLNIVGSNVVLVAQVTPPTPPTPFTPVPGLGAWGLGWLTALLAGAAALLSRRRKSTLSSNQAPF